MSPAGLDPQDLDLILQTVRALGKDLLCPERCLEWDREEVFPEEAVRTLMGPRVGLHLLFLPTGCGGLGAGTRDLCRVSEELARLDLGVATTLLGVALGCDPLRVGGTDEQKDRWLGEGAARGLLVAYGVTEPEAGSDVAALKTRAEPVRDGDRVVAYRLSGTKQFITNGSVADLYAILARAPGGPSFFVVERGAPGLSRGPAERKHGIRCSDTAQVILDEVEVPADHLVGLQEGQGLRQANLVFGHTRLMGAAMALGAGAEAMTRAVAYSRERTQFGRPLCQLEGYVGKLLLPHQVRLEAARAYINETCDRLDSGEEGLQTEGAVAKLFSSEAANRAAEAAIQALGGYGYTHEYMVEKIKRDVRITTIYEGTSEVLQNLVYLFRLRPLIRGGACYEEMARPCQGGEEVAADLLRRCAAVMDRLLLVLHERKISRHQGARFLLVDRMVDLEHALALSRHAAGGPAALQAACRLFAAETAAGLAVCAARLFASSGLGDEEIRRLTGELSLDDLLLSRHGSREEADLVAGWLLDRGR